METLLMKLKAAHLFLFCLVSISPCYAAPWVSHIYPNDFDGDKKSDLCVWRPSTAEWYCVPSSGAVISGWTPVGAGPGSVIQWGLPGDMLVPGDYDNDGKTDAAVLRPGTMNWYIRYSSGGTATVQHGLNGDVRITGPLFATAGNDLAVYRPSTDQLYCKRVNGTGSNWALGPYYVSGTYGSFPWFQATAAHWFAKYNSNQIRIFRIGCDNGFGNYLDYTLSHSGKITAGAYLAGQTNYDYVHFLNNAWRIYPWYSTNSPLVVTWGWGLSNDLPVKGDFDGDSLADLAVYNNGSWRVYSSGYFYGQPPPHMLPYGSNPGDYWFQWGLPGDIPIE